MARAAHIWHAQLMLLCKRQMKLARRQPVTTILLIFAPVLALIPLLLLKWTAGSMSMPECHKRPIALPAGTSESSARYLQSVFCGFDLPCISERDRKINPNIYYERSILPRWWADVLPLVSNESNTREFSQLLASAQVFLEADFNWHRSEKVRQAVVKWVDEMYFNAKFWLGEENFDSDDESEADGQSASHSGDELQRVLRKAQQITQGASRSFGNTSFSFTDIQNYLYHPDHEDARNQITTSLIWLAETGLFSVDGFKAFLAHCSASKSFLSEATDISMRYLPVFLDRWQTVKQTLQRSHQTTTIPPTVSLGAMYKTSVCGVDVVAETKKQVVAPTTTGTSSTGRSKMSHVLESLAEVIAETRFDAAVVDGMLKSLMGPELYEQQMPRELLAIQALLDQTFSSNNTNLTEANVPSIYSYQQVCSSFEREASRLVLGNMFYSMIKPLTNGRILYYADDETNHADVDAVLQATNDMLRPVRLTLSYPLQILNIFTNIGYARQNALSPQHDRLLTKILSKAIRRLAITIDGGDAGPPMSMDDLSQLLQNARDLITEVVVWLRQVLDVQKIITDKCLPWQSNVYAERVHSREELETLARALESKRGLLSAVVFSSPTTNGEEKRRISYELQMDVDRMKALPSMSGPMDELLAAGSVVGNIQYYLNFLPFQNILDRAIMEHYDHKSTSLRSNITKPDLPDTVYIEAFPRPCSNINVLSFILQRSFRNILIMLGIAFGTGVMTRQIVADRERMLDRLLRLHGLRVGVRSCSWWLTWLALWSLVTAVIIIFESFNNMIPYSNELLQYILLFSIFAQNMALNYAIGAFFDRPVLAAGVSVSVLVFSLVPSLFRLANSYILSYMQVVLLCAFPMVPLLLFTIYTTRYDSAQVGLQFSNWMYSTEMWDAFSPRSIFFVTLTYTAVYIGIGALARFIRDVKNDRLAASCTVCAVLPKTWKLNKLFCCCAQTRAEEVEQRNAERRLNADRPQANSAVDTESVETVRAICIKHVTKLYKKAGVISWLLNTRLFGRFLHWILKIQNRHDANEQNRAAESINPADDDEYFRVGHLAVRNVSLTLHDNEIACVVGPNGAGKSTLMALMCGFLHPTSGEIELYGESMYTARARNIIGYCPQNNVLLECMTVREHLEFFSSLKGYTSHRRDRQVDSAIRRMELEPFGRQYAQTLSGGYQRRLMMALAFACGDNQLIVLDEPCAGVDPAARHELWQLISRQRQRGYAVVVNTHHLQEAECFADRVVIMKRGRVCVVESMPMLCEAYTGGALHNSSDNAATAPNAAAAAVMSPLKQPTWQIVVETLPPKVFTSSAESTRARDVVTQLVRSAFPSAVLSIGEPSSDEYAVKNNNSIPWHFKVCEKYSPLKKKLLLERCLTYCRTSTSAYYAAVDHHNDHSESSSSSGLDGADDGVAALTDTSHTTSSGSVSSPNCSPVPPASSLHKQRPQPDVSAPAVIDDVDVVIMAVHFNIPTLEDVCKAVQIMDNYETAAADAAATSAAEADEVEPAAAEHVVPKNESSSMQSREMTVFMPNESAVVEHMEVSDVHVNDTFSSSSAFMLERNNTAMPNSKNVAAPTAGRRSSLASIVSSFSSNTKHPTRFARLIKAVIRTRLLQSSVVMRQAFALACKRFIHYSRTYQRTAIMLAIPLAMIFLGTLVARSTRRLPTDNRVPPFQLDPMATYWPYPTFYAYDDDDDVDSATSSTTNGTHMLLNILQTDADFNTLNGAYCSRCQSAAVRLQQVRQLRQRFLSSMNHDSDLVFVRASDVGHGCAPVGMLPLPAETTVVKQAILVNVIQDKIIDVEKDYFGNDGGVVAVHVGLPRRHLKMALNGDDAASGAGEDVLFIKPRNTMIPQLFGGYTIMMADETNSNSTLSTNARIKSDAEVMPLHAVAVPPSSTYIKIWHNTAMGWSASQYLTRLNSALFKWQQQRHGAEAVGQNYALLEAFVRPLPLTRGQIELGGTEKMTLDTAATMMFVFGMTFVPAFAIAYIVAERQRGERKVQLLGGVSSSTYWITSSLFDYLLLYSLIIIGSWLILTIWHIDSFSHHDRYFDALFAVIAVYGLNALAMSYLLSYLFHDPHVAFVSIYALLCCAGFVAALLVNPDNFYGQMLRDKHKYRIEDDRVFMWLIPSYNMGQAIVRMLTQKFESFGFKKVLCSALNVHHTDDETEEKAEEDAVMLCERALTKDPFEWNTTGRHINAMVLSTIIMLVIVIAIEWLSENWSAVVGAIQWSKLDDYQQQINEEEEDEAAENDAVGTSEAARLCAFLTPQKVLNARRRRKLQLRQRRLGSAAGEPGVEMTQRNNADSVSQEECVVKCDRVWHSYKVSKWRHLKNAGHVRNRRKRRQTHRVTDSAADSSNDEPAVADEGVGDLDAEEAAGTSVNNLPPGILKVGGIRERDYIAKNVSIAVRRGESCALFGYNGAGKTTVFRCLTGQVTPLRGRIVFNAADFNSSRSNNENDVAAPNTQQNSTTICRNPSTGLAGFIGYCPQTEPLEEQCTIYEHLLLYALMKNVQVSTLALQIAHVLRYVAIGREFLHGPVARSLSGGTRRKLSAAMALLNRPRLVLMDEATAGVDALAREAVARTLAVYAREQRAAVVFTSHNVADACASSRIAVLSNGRIVLNESLQAINERFSGRFFHIKIFFRTNTNAVAASSAGDDMLTVEGKEIMPLLSSSLSPSSSTPPSTVQSPLSKRVSRDLCGGVAGDGRTHAESFALENTNSVRSRVAARIERILHKFYATLFELDYTVNSHQMSGRMLQMIVIAPAAVASANVTENDDGQKHTSDHDNIKKARKRAAQSAKLLNERLLSEDSSKLASSSSPSCSSAVAHGGVTAHSLDATRKVSQSAQMQLYRLFFDVCRGNINIATNNNDSETNAENINDEVYIEEFSVEPSSTEQILTMLASENASDFCGDTT